MMPPGSSQNPGELVLYQTVDGRTRVQVRLTDGTVWLSLNQLADLFQRDKSVISKHIRNIFAEGELAPERTVAKFATVQNEGPRSVNSVIEFYRLEMIVAVGYRVKSLRGTQFRQWATERLEEYMVKGFTMDDERLKNPAAAGFGLPDHFDELLERIRDIRASEKRVYLRVREIFALAGDYDSRNPETAAFFQAIQNKLHYAATGKTAAELIASRANCAEPNMGLTAWKSGAVRKADVTVAKNYLTAPEIEELNRIVVMWLDFAEDQARRRKQVFLQDWEAKLDSFLALNDRAILGNRGKVAKADADALAEAESQGFGSLEETAKSLADSRKIKATPKD
jgi:hypothetical protein